MISEVFHRFQTTSTSPVRRILTGRMRVPPNTVATNLPGKRGTRRKVFAGCIALACALLLGIVLFTPLAGALLLDPKSGVLRVPGTLSQQESLLELYTAARVLGTCAATERPSIPSIVMKNRC